MENAPKDEKERVCGMCVCFKKGGVCILDNTYTMRSHILKDLVYIVQKVNVFDVFVHYYRTFSTCTRFSVITIIFRQFVANL